MIVFFQDSTIDNLPLGQAYFNQAVIYMSVEFIIGSLFILILSKLFKHEVISRSSFYTFWFINLLHCVWSCYLWDFL